MAELAPDNQVETAPGRATPDSSSTPDLNHSSSAGRELAQNFVSQPDQSNSPTASLSYSQQLEQVNELVSSEARANLREVLDNPNATTTEKEQAVAALHKMISEPRREGVNAIEIVESTIKTMADPYSNDQADRRSCATTTQTRIAQRPAVYAEMMEGLTSTQGSYTFESGAQIGFVENSALVDASIKDGSPIASRTLDTRIAQSALMQFYADVGTEGTGIKMQYDAVRDVHIDITSGVETSGTYPDWLQRGNNLIFNEASYRYDTTNVGPGGMSAEAVLFKVQESIERNQGEPVITEITTSSDRNADHALHYVQVTEVKDGRVYFSNGWQNFSQIPGCASHTFEMTEDGRIESMSIQDFSNIMRSATIPDPDSSDLDAPRPPLQVNRQYASEDTSTHHPIVDPPSVNRPTEQPDVSSSNLQRSTHEVVNEFLAVADLEKARIEAGLVERGAAQRASAGRRDEDDMF